MARAKWLGPAAAAAYTELLKLLPLPGNLTDTNAQRSWKSKAIKQAADLGDAALQLPVVVNNDCKQTCQCSTAGVHMQVAYALSMTTHRQCHNALCFTLK